MPIPILTVAIETAVGGDATLLTNICEFTSVFAERTGCWISRLGALAISPRCAYTVLRRVGNGESFIFTGSRSNRLLVY